METKIAATCQDWLPQVVIRPLMSADLPALEWDGEFRHFRRVYAQAYERSLQGYVILWVAELPGTGVIGQVFIQLISDRLEVADGLRRAYLYSFRVRGAFRQAGLGSRMLAFVEEDLKQRGFEYITLNVAKENERALRLYLRQGYKIVGEDPGCWSYPDENGIWHQVEEPSWRMQKHLWDMRKTLDGKPPRYT